MSKDLRLSSPFCARVQEVRDYITKMENERQGWGTRNEDPAATATSFINGLATLMGAERVWVDGPTGFSFGGIMAGGIEFGMIARECPTQDGVFNHPPIAWTFHS